MALFKLCRSTFGCFITIMVVLFSKPTNSNGNNLKVQQRHTFRRLPNFVFTRLLQTLSKRDQLECMCVCKEWYRRFFVIQYHAVNFKRPEQLESFIINVTRATQLLGHAATATCVTTVTIDHAFQFLTLIDTFQQIFILCQHLRVLDISWWQLYIFLITDADSGNKSARHLSHLQRLTVRRISNVTAAHAASYYRYRTMIDYAAKNPEDSLAVFEKSMYKVPVLTDLLRYTPNLNGIWLYFCKADELKISEQDLESFHRFCPKLRQLLLSNVTLYLADDSITGPISDHYTVAKNMKYFGLKMVHFDELEQPLLHDYFAFKYQNVVTLDIWQPQLRNDSSCQDIAKSFFWPHLERLTFKNANESTFPICLSIVSQIGRFSSFTNLGVGGLKLPGSKRHPRYHTVTVDMDWIRQTCLYLRFISLTHTKLQGSKKTLTFASSRSFVQGQVVRQLILQRKKSTNGHWILKSYS